MIKVFTASSKDTFAYNAMTGEIMRVPPKLVGDTPKKTQAAVEAHLRKTGRMPQKRFSAFRWEKEFDEYMAHIETHVPTLILQLTCRCNLNCDYCVYSGNYAHMLPHSANEMSFETIRRSIDFYAEHNRDEKTAMVDLYGGEVLLCMERVQAAISYARERIAGKPLRFRMTSNGVLLTRDVARWLQKNPDVHVNVTVNGPHHDRHRKMLGGQGSLERIMKNLRVIREEFPDVWERQIDFLSNVAQPGHVFDLIEFFHKELGKAPVTITHIRDQDGNDHIADIVRSDGEADGTAQLASLYVHTFDPVLRAYFDQSIASAHNRIIYPKDFPGLVGGCFPFTGKLFVHYNGDFGVCETASDRLILGNLDDGFDREKLRALYDQVQALTDRCCSTCWAHRRCSMCLKDYVNPDGTIMREMPGGMCRAMRRYVKQQLRIYIEMAQRCPERLAQMEVRDEDQ